VTLTCCKKGSHPREQHTFSCGAKIVYDRFCQKSCCHKIGAGPWSEILKRFFCREEASCRQLCPNTPPKGLLLRMYRMYIMSQSRLPLRLRVLQVGPPLGWEGSPNEPQVAESLPESANFCKSQADIFLSGVPTRRALARRKKTNHFMELHIHRAA
jgi:hypothetical protein